MRRVFSALVVSGLLVCGLLVFALTVLGFVPSASAADLTLKQKVTLNIGGGGPMSGERTMEHVLYLHGEMLRSETEGGFGGGLMGGMRGPGGGRGPGAGNRTQSGAPPQMVRIQNCSTHDTLMLSPRTREYVEIKPGERPGGVRARRDGQTGNSTERPPAAASGGKMIVEVNTTDTGETKSMFGQTAHHYVTTIKRYREGEFPTSEETIDAWYVPLGDAAAESCVGLAGGVAGFSGRTFSFLTAGNQAPPELKRTGPTPQGVVVQGTFKSHSSVTGRDGNVHEFDTTGSLETTEFSAAAVNPDLFKVPSGYKKAGNMREMMGREE